MRKPFDRHRYRVIRIPVIMRRRVRPSVPAFNAKANLSLRAESEFRHACRGIRGPYIVSFTLDAAPHGSHANILSETRVCELVSRRIRCGRVTGA